MKSFFALIITTVITGRAESQKNQTKRFQNIYFLGTTSKPDDYQTMIDTFLSQQLPIGDTKIKLADSIEHIEKTCTDGLGLI